MSSVNYVFSVRSSGTPQTGLNPSFKHFKILSTNFDFGSPPVITEIANGQYTFSYDPEANGEAVAQIDAGVSLSDPGDRYIDVVMTLDSARLAHLPEEDAGTPGGVSTFDPGADPVVLAEDGFDLIELEPGVSLFQALTIMAAALGGNVEKTVENEKITIRISGINNPDEVRVVATSDNQNNRTVSNLNF